MLLEKSLLNPGKLGSHARFGVIVLLVVHVGLLAWSSTLHSPSNGEVPALAAGVWHWQKGRFDLFRVNPPLVRSVAALPVLAMRPETDWGRFGDRIGYRSAFDVGPDFVAANGEHAFWLFTVARWACIPFSILGALVCYLWARDMYGRRAGFMALALWCFSPNILAHAQMITADAPAAACGVLACYLFWKWLQFPTWLRALAVGASLGLVLLVKTTWLLLFPLWPLLWLAWSRTEGREQTVKSVRRQGLQLTCVLVLGIVCVNLGYGGERVLRPLGRLKFVSRTLGGDVPAKVRCSKGANRFRDTWLKDMPVPLPENFVLGLDIQKRDFEVGLSSYMRGRWHTRGWWYYYLYAFAIKTPIGTLLLILLALGLSLVSSRHREAGCSEMIVLAPALAILLLVSSQTGMCHHFRYVLPAYPFLFIFAAKVVGPAGQRGGLLPWISVGALAGTIASSICAYPHSLSYFSEIVGGPERGSEHLLGSSTDWGQDILFLEKWCSDHPDARPLHLAHVAYFDPAIAGIDFREPPVDPRWDHLSCEISPSRLGPHPGWHAISVNQLRSCRQQYSYFLDLEPVATAGYSIYIYHITLEDANRVRRELGLPELPEDYKEAPERPQQ